MGVLCGIFVLIQNGLIAETIGMPQTVLYRLNALRLSIPQSLLRRQICPVLLSPTSPPVVFVVLVC